MSNRDIFQYDFVVGIPTPVGATAGFVNSLGTNATAVTTNAMSITTTGNNGLYAQAGGGAVTYSGTGFSTICVPQPQNWWPWGQEIHHYHWYPQYIWAEEAFSKTKELFSSSSNFPPVNAHQQKDGSLLLEFAFAGYKKDEINLTFEGDTLVLTSDGHERPDYEKAREIKRGIKLSKFEIKYQLAPDHFDTSKTKAKFEDGILSITIPLAESKIPKAVEIE
jgi:HSP20 family molecular chaperone IbpA